MRDYQLNIANKYVNYVDDKGGALLEMDTGMGKTVLALYILSKLNVKTIILVHKEFLNQWVERINEFLPDAKIGRIQGKILNIEDCDIVMGMIQSISTKNYDNTLFSSFGLTIIDEVHHMGAEVFSQALNKVVTQYTLGLSATMQRKDGLSNVFKMFLGNILHSEKRSTVDTNVLVNKLVFEVNDSDYNEIIYDYRGNPSYVKMISKICEYNPRSEFILEVIQDVVLNNPLSHILLLAHNKSLLKYLFEAINYRKICDVGYYVGGMKESDLKISETKKVILATYSMAAEGLDIKSLNTLILASPKTDVIQSVGRILRTQHVQPVIYDIVDTHDNFENNLFNANDFIQNKNIKSILLSLNNLNQKIMKQYLIHVVKIKKKQLKIYHLLENVTLIFNDLMDKRKKELD